MTTDILIREDTGTHAVVRVIDPGIHVSAPYSRACGLLDKWVKDERHAVDEFSAWVEGQAAQAKAEMRALCDELGAPFAWAELPDQPGSVKRAEHVALFDRDNPHDRIGLGMGPALRARYGTIGGPSPYQRPGWLPRRPSDVMAEMYEQRFNPVQEYMDADTGDDMPGRDASDARGWTPQGVFPLVPGSPTDVLIVHRRITDDQAARIKRYWQERHGKPVEVQTGPQGRFTRWLDEQLQRAERWWRGKQAERDARMGVGDE